MSDDEREGFREADGSDEPGPAAGTLMAFEWARELLLGDGDEERGLAVDARLVVAGVL